MARRSRSRRFSWVASMAVAALIVYLMWVWFAPDAPSDPNEPPDTSQTSAEPNITITVRPPTGVTERANDGPNEPTAIEHSIIPPPPSDPTTPLGPQAEQSYSQGAAALATGDLVKARTLLSEALASGALTPSRAADCRARLTDIAATVVFGRQLYPGDEYSRRYVVQANDTLGKIVERETLFVPWQGIARINQIDDVRRIRPGQWIKLVQGPFDAIVTKGSFTLDLYHHGMFLKSYRIGLGQNGSTPTGRWIVRPGGRVAQAPWTPPAGTGQAHTIEFGQDGYPLGPKGLWIALQGIDPETEILVGFGIHGTNEPDSIGRQASLGCIRLGDNDIDELFGLLYGGKSTVEVRP